MDKLSLNNLIQDNTYMKDYLVYQMMNEFGVNSPLCSYVYITVNGEDWGLYLAVEGVEESFLTRNYSSNYGELYKPDSLSMNQQGGMDTDMSQRPNGGEMPEGFDMPQMPSGGMPNGEVPEGFDMPQMPSGGMPNGEVPEGFDMSQMPSGGMPNGEVPESVDMSQMPSGGMPNGEVPEGVDMPQIPSGGMPNGEVPDNVDVSQMPNRGQMAGGMGSNDVKLQYIDDDPESYSNIFDNAKTDVSETDKNRLIDSLQKLSNGEDLENIVDIEQVIRYFVVHNFVCNSDSYTGTMIHNYYLYEENGKMSMIPWDYNLAFGSFQGSQDATSAINEPIDSPVSSGNMSDRPMIAWIFENEEYTQMYHTYFKEFIEMYDTNGRLSEIITGTKALIASYVEKDPTKFCSYEEFEIGVETLEQFCLLRAESVEGQLDGTIGSTTTAQNENKDACIDGSNINLSALGTMGNGRGFDGRFSSQNNESSENDFGNKESMKNEMNFEKVPSNSSIENTENDTTEDTSLNNRENMNPGNRNDGEENTTENEKKDIFSSNRVPKDFSNFENKGDFSNQRNSASINIENFVLLGVSFVIMIIGLVIAKKYKR